MFVCFGLVAFRRLSGSELNQLEVVLGMWYERGNMLSGEGQYYEYIRFAEGMRQRLYFLRKRVYIWDKDGERSHILLSQREEVQGRV